MVTAMVSGGFKAVFWSLAGAGFASLLLAGLIAWPLHQPPELKSISAYRNAMDFSALPELTRFQARDGSALAYRHYPAQAPSTGRIAVVVHGSSGSSQGAVHALSLALAARGVQIYAVDIRGHGASGNRGDIAYLGQLEDDMADLVTEIRKTNPTAPLTLARSFLRWRICVAYCRLFDPESVHTHRAAGALSRLRRPEQPAQLRRLGQSGYSAFPRVVGLAQTGDAVGGIAAGDRLRRAAEFEPEADRGLFLPA